MPTHFNICAYEAWRRCARMLKGGTTKLLTAENIKHSERTPHSARLRCEEMRLILWNGDPYLACRRNRTGLLDPPSKQRSQ